MLLIWVNQFSSYFYFRYILWLFFCFPFTFKSPYQTSVCRLNRRFIQWGISVYTWNHYIRQESFQSQTICVPFPLHSMSKRWIAGSRECCTTLISARFFHQFPGLCSMFYKQSLCADQNENLFPHIPYSLVLCIILSYWLFKSPFSLSWITLSTLMLGLPTFGRFPNLDRDERICLYIAGSWECWSLRI